MSSFAKEEAQNAGEVENAAKDNPFTQFYSMLLHQGTHRAVFFLFGRLLTLF